MRQTPPLPYIESEELHLLAARIEQTRTTQPQRKLASIFDHCYSSAASVPGSDDHPHEHGGPRLGKVVKAVLLDQVRTHDAHAQNDHLPT